MDENKKIDTARFRKKISLSREALRLVWKSSPGWTIINVIVSVARSVLPLAIVWLIKILTDSLTVSVNSGSDVPGSRIIILIVIAALLYFIDEALSEYGAYARKKQSNALELYMYELLHSKSVSVDLINFEKAAYFDSLSRAAREAPWRPNNILNNLVSLTRALISFVLMAGLLLTSQWIIAIVLLVSGLPSIWLRLHYASVLYNFQKQQTPETRKAAYFNWLLTGDRPAREIRLFGLGKYFMTLFRQSYRRQKDEELKIIRTRMSIELVSGIVKAAGLFIVFWIIARATTGKTISLGEMAMLLVAFRQGMIFLREVLSSAASLYEDSLYIEDAFEFLNLGDTIRVEAPELIPSSLTKELNVNHLTFSYPDSERRIINDVSFEIKKGEIIAIVGPNGAGKSTLVKLLCRLYDPDSGSVEYDGNNIRRFDPDLYRKNLSVVFQDFMLYNLPAGENIRMGNIDEPEPGQGIRIAGSLAGLDSVMKKLPSGYDSMIGNLFEDSHELSWGEWQKLAIARALFRSAPVLILDEPSSSLDADTEFEIFSRFRELTRGRTSILISHRFTNVSLADRIIVLDEGSVAETGTHEQLLQSGGIYCKMFTKQSSLLNQKKSQ